MFFSISKLFFYLILPIPLVVFLYLASYAPFLSYKFSLWMRRISIILLIVFSNEFLANSVFKLLEADPVKIEDLGRYDIGVVFTGMTLPSNEPKDRVHFGPRADRITDAVQLYKLGRIDMIRVSVGSPFLDDVYNEADALKMFLLYSGVPDSVIIIENQAVNTYQNAQFTARLIDQDYPQSTVLLITSGFHVPRASACLKKAGMEFDVYPSDIRSYPVSWHPDLFFPTAQAIEKWEHINKELTGLMVYKLMGYI
jgi:uncharacterized SAM-binding protein YcdF (DUF218 family)